jgi:replicative DNA helicase
MTEETTVEIPASDPISEDTGSPETHYKFDEAFQAKIAALCLRDTQFMQRAEGLVKPEYLENVADAILVNIANRYFAKYKKVPGDVTILTALIRHDAINKVIRKEHVGVVVARVKELIKHDISDRDYVIDQVATFARHQAVSKAILDSVGHLDINDFDKISSALKEALDVGEHGDSTGYDYAGMIEARTEERIERAAGKLPPSGITTGYPELDRLLYHKGWGKRELSVLMGGAKAGKTTALIDFAVSACGHYNRYNVLYITLEVAAKIIAERMDARISQQVMSELGSHIHDVKDKVKKFMERAGKFIIHEFPTGSMRVSDLRRLIERYKARGITFDMIVVDYADLMAPERFTDNAIENSKNVYVALRGLAMQEDLAILTATQTNREGAKKAVATMTDISEDFNKVRIADIIISINRTDEELKMNQARLYFAACRNQAGGFSIRIQQDLERMTFIKEVIGAE